MEDEEEDASAKLPVKSPSAADSEPEEPVAADEEDDDGESSESSSGGAKQKKPKKTKPKKKKKKVKVTPKPKIKAAEAKSKAVKKKKRKRDSGSDSETEEKRPGKKKEAVSDEERLADEAEEKDDTDEVSYSSDTADQRRRAAKREERKRHRRSALPESERSAKQQELFAQSIKTSERLVALKEQAESERLETVVRPPAKTLEELRKEYPARFDPNAPSNAPLDQKLEKEIIEYRPLLVQTLLEELKKCTPGPRAVDRSFRVPQYNSQFIAKISRQGGEWTNAEGEQLSLPTCCRGELCVVQQYEIRVNRVDEKVSTQIHGFAPGLRPPMMAWLTPEEYETVFTEKRRLEIRRQCVWCEAFHLSSAMFMIRNGSPTLSVAEAAFRQPFCVPRDVIGGFHSVYTVEVSSQTCPGIPEPFLRFDTRGLTARYPPELNGAYILDISAMMFHRDAGLRERFVAKLTGVAPAPAVASASSSSSAAAPPRPTQPPKKPAARVVGVSGPAVSGPSRSGTEGDQNKSERNFRKADDSPLAPSASAATARESEPKEKLEGKDAGGYTVEWALNNYRKVLAPEKKAQRKRCNRLQSEKDQVRRIDRELLLAAKRPQLLRARQKSCRHVENLFAKAKALLSIREVGQYPDARELGKEITHKVFLEFLSDAPMVSGCVRFDQLKQEEGKVLDGVIAQCRRARVLLAIDQRLQKTLQEVLEECKLNAVEEKRRFEGMPNRVWLHLIRFLLSHRAARAALAAEAAFEAEQNRILMESKGEREKQADLLSRLEAAEQLAREVHYHATCIADSFLFLFGDHSESDDRVLDPHLEIATAGVCGENLPVLTEVVERAFSTTDEAGKRSAFVHVAQKLRPRRSQRRMWIVTLEKKMEKDSGMREYVTRAVLCSLLGNYMQIPARARIGLRMRLILRNGGSGMVLFLLRNIQSLSYHALHQHMFLLIRGVPHLMQHCCQLFEFNKLSKDVDRLMSDTVRQLALHQERLHSFWSVPEKREDETRVSKKLRDAVLTINSSMETESVNMVLTVTYHKERRGFLGALLSRAKAMEQAAAKKKLSAASSKSAADKEKERELALSKALEQSVRKDLAGLAERDAAPQPLANVDPGLASKSRFGLSEEVFDGLRRVVAASDPNSNCPEAFLFKALPAFGVPPRAVSRLLEICGDFQSGDSGIDGKLASFALSYPHSFEVASTFAVLYKRRAVFTLGELPSRYVPNQVAAIKKRFGIADTVDALPKEGSELLYCEVCLGVFSDLRDMIGRYHIFGRDAGYNNVKVDLDPLKPRVEKYCNGNSTFADRCCWKQPLRSIDLLGKSLLYRDELYIICPQPGCGMPSSMCPYRSAVTEYGIACSDCTLCLAAASIDLESQGIEGFIPMSHFACRLLQDRLEGGPEAVGCKLANKRQSKVMCEVCQRLRGHEDIRDVTLNGIKFRICKTHSYESFEDWKKAMKVATVPRPECAVEGRCSCEALDQRCFEEITSDMILKFLRVNNNVYYFVSMAAKKMQTQYGARAQRPKKRPRK